LTAERVAELRSRISAGEKKAVLAREFGISRETLYQYAPVTIKRSNPFTKTEAKNFRPDAKG